MRADRIDHRGLLADEQMASAVKHQTTLLLRRLGWHEPHVGSGDRLANRLCVSHVVLPPFEKRRQEFVHCVSTFRFQAASAIVGHAAVHSMTIAWSFPSADGARGSSRTSGIAASDRIIINLKSSI